MVHFLPEVVVGFDDIHCFSLPFTYVIICIKRFYQGDNRYANHELSVHSVTRNYRTIIWSASVHRTIPPDYSLLDLTTNENKESQENYKT